MTDHFAAERIKELERQVDMQALEIKRLSKFERNVIELLDKQVEYYDKKSVSLARGTGRNHDAIFLYGKAEALQDFRTKLLIKHIVESESE